MPSFARASLGFAFTLAAGVACSASGGGSGDDGSSGGSGGSGTGATGSGGTLNLGGQGGGGGLGGQITLPPNCNSPDANADNDGDGFTPSTGDCNDCTEQMNPGAYDYPANSIDEDCNGAVDDEPTACDQQVYDVGYGDPNVAAQALGLCRVSNGTSWGVVSAKYVKIDGAPGMADLSHGLLPRFGDVIGPRSGVSMLALSSGTARNVGDPGYIEPVDFTLLDGGANMFTQSPTPGAYPIPSQDCPNQGLEKRAYDPAAFEIVIKVPTNANRFSFDFDFYTAEYPNYICNAYNDYFIALVNPTPQNALEGNVSFDSRGSPVSVNGGFVEVCAPGNHGGKNFPCALGTAELGGTGYARGAATGWLTTASPAPAGETVTIRFAIWDAGDWLLDSLVLLDNFTWSIGQGTAPVTQRPPE